MTDREKQVVEAVENFVFGKMAGTKDKVGKKMSGGIEKWRHKF